MHRRDPRQRGTLQRTCSEQHRDNYGSSYIAYQDLNSISRDALALNLSVYSLVLERGFLSKEKLDLILVPENMIKPVKLK
ncbi:MAG: hypothetical protein WAW07_04750 [Bacteroidales bacterium]